MSDRPTIAFVGTGVMGGPMAGHLLDAGYPLVVFNRTRAKADALVARGAVWADSPGGAAGQADIVITMVGYPADVEAIYLGAGGIIERARPGAYLVDMTTSSPELAERIGRAADERGLHAMDAPVSGGDVGARNATLTIFVGGDEAACSAVEDVLRVLGKMVTRFGECGAGQHAKMANQVAIAGVMLSTIESLAYAKAAGLDPRLALESMGGGSAQSWALANYGPRILDDNLDPGFFVKHFIKDMRIALDAAEAMQISLPGLEVAMRLYERLAEAGGAELGTHALWLLYAGEDARRSHGLDAAATAADAAAGAR